MASKNSKTKLSIPPYEPCPVVLQALSFLTPDTKQDVKADNGTDTFELTRKDRLEVLFSPSQLRAARSVFSPGKTYRFRLNRSGTLVSGGGGSLALSSGVAVVDMDDQSSFNSLFSEARLISTRIQIINLAPTGGPNPLAIAFNPNAVQSASITYSDLQRIPGVRTVNTWNTVASPIMCYWHSKVKRPWSPASATPTASGDPVGGLIGAWQYVLGTVVTGAVNTTHYLIECDYEFRNPS